jgi:MEDS: MEthanogen/methylotroph, DcmR Sensory domain
MSPTRTTESGHFHAVRFYKDAASLADIVCAFLAEGLRQGEPAVVIATPEHTRYFRECLAAKAVDVEAAIGHGTLTLLDADETLTKFMRDGIPMAQPFRNTLTPILSSIAARHPGASIRAYGEMVDLLWKRNQTAAAIRLETLWNDLARAHQFELLCGYAMGNFYKGSSADEICAVHSHIVTETGSHVRLA